MVPCVISLILSFGASPRLEALAKKGFISMELKPDREINWLGRRVSSPIVGPDGR